MPKKRVPPTTMHELYSSIPPKESTIRIKTGEPSIYWEAFGRRDTYRPPPVRAYVNDPPWEFTPDPNLVRYPIVLLQRGLQTVNEVDALHFLAVDRQVQVAKEEVDKLQLFVTTTQGEVNALCSSYAASIPGRINELRDLSAEINKLQGIEEPTPPFTDEEGAREHHLKVEREKDQHAEQLQAARAGDKEFKKAWKELSMMCHPDRTKDKALHELYQSGFNAKQVNDLPLLLAVLKEAKLYKRFGRFRKDKLELLRTRLSELANERNIWKQRAEATTQSDAYKILETSKVNPFAAQQMYYQIINHQLEQMRQQVYQLKIRKAHEEAEAMRKELGLKTANFTYHFTHSSGKPFG